MHLPRNDHACHNTDQCKAYRLDLAGLEGGFGLPSPVIADAKQAVKGPCRIAAPKYNCLASQHNHGVPVAGGRGCSYHPQAVPGEGDNVQDMNIVHETPCSFWITAAKHQHEVGRPHDSCMVGPWPGGLPPA